MSVERRWITVAEAADYLAIHPVTCRRLIDRDEIPASRIGRSVRVDLLKLEALLAESEAEPG